MVRTGKKTALLAAAVAVSRRIAPVVALQTYATGGTYGFTDQTIAPIPTIYNGDVSFAADVALDLQA